MTRVECPTCHRSLNDTAPETTPRPDAPDLLELLQLTRVQTARSTARQLYGTAEPSRAEVERARRRLEQLVRDGHATVRRGADKSTSVPGDLYLPVAPADLSDV